MEAIVAVYSDWGIGDGKTQPVTLHADRMHFREITAGAAVIVGKKTMEDFPGGKPLKDRTNIVLTRQDAEIPGAVVVHDTQEAVAAANRYARCIVIGGASVYEQLFPYMDKVYITKIRCCPESVRFFPDLDQDENWSCTWQSPEAEENGIRYRFCTYERKGEQIC